MKHKINGSIPKLKKNGREYQLTEKHKAWLEMNKNAPRTELAKCLGVSRNSVNSIMEKLNISFKARRKKSRNEKDRDQNKRAYTAKNAHYIFVSAICYCLPSWVWEAYSEEGEESFSKRYIESRFPGDKKKEVEKHIVSEFGNDIAKELDSDTLDSFGLLYCDISNMEERFSQDIEVWAENYFPGDETFIKLSKEHEEQSDRKRAELFGLTLDELHELDGIGAEAFMRNHPERANGHNS